MFVGIYAARYLGASASDIESATTGEHCPAGSLHLYRAELQEALSDYVGRLFIDWGSGTRAWVQRPTTTKAITELRPTFREPEFPGYLNLITNLSAISAMPTTWRSALQSARGIYLLTCPRTGEWYVGSAYGNDGFFGRWQQYADDGHGGNIQLRSRERSDYQVSILEVAGSALSDVEVIALESHWKRKLQSREAGLNRN